MGVDRPDWGPGGEERNAVIVPTSGPSETRGELGFPENPVADALPSAHVSDGNMTGTLGAEWSRSGGVETRFAVAQAGANAVLGNLDPDDVGRFSDSFDAIPEAAQSAIVLELSLGEPGFVKPASDAALKAFEATDIGDLVGEWRGRAPRNLGIARDRIGRMLDRMGAGEVDAAVGWFDGLAPDHARAVLRALVR